MLVSFKPLSAGVTEGWRDERTDWINRRDLGFLVLTIGTFSYRPIYTEFSRAHTPQKSKKKIIDFMDSHGNFDNYQGKYINSVFYRSSEFV